MRPAQSQKVTAETWAETNDYASDVKLDSLKCINGNGPSERRKLEPVRHLTCLGLQLKARDDASARTLIHHDVLQGVGRPCRPRSRHIGSAQLKYPKWTNYIEAPRTRTNRSHARSSKHKPQSLSGSSWVSVRSNPVAYSRDLAILNQCLRTSQLDPMSSSLHLTRDKDSTEPAELFTGLQEQKTLYRLFNAKLVLCGGPIERTMQVPLRN